MAGTIIAAAVLGVGASAIAVTALGFAINLVISSVISKVFAAKQDAGGYQQSPNPGNTQQVPPATDNKLSVVYGTSYVGGTIVDLSISRTNQNLFYIFSLSEVTGQEATGSFDAFSFGNIYWGGKRCIFDTTDRTRVIALLDESNNQQDTSVDGKLFFYLYSNGVNGGYNTTQTAIQVMQDPDLVYQWDATKQFYGACFAICKIVYSQSANLTGLQTTRFQIINSRTNPGACLLDYLVSERYGCGIPLTQIDTANLIAWDAYNSEPLTYTDYQGQTQVLPKRFTFNGSLDTNQVCLANAQAMADSADAIIKYNEILGLWGVVIQQPNYTIALDLDDSNITSALQISYADISSTFNIIEVKFPDQSYKDSFNSATFDLANINPSLLYANEPTNKQTVTLSYVNNDVVAQLIANRMLESARSDLFISCDMTFEGMQLEAGDIVSLTNGNYGFNAKLFRVMRSQVKFGGDGQITTSLSLQEFEPAAWDDRNITQFTPAPNSGIASATTFGTLQPPQVMNVNVLPPNPNFQLLIQASSSGLINYAEVYYATVASPSSAQMIFLGTTVVSPAGNPYAPNSFLPNITVDTLNPGNYYFFSRMVNSLASSSFSAASGVLAWRPTNWNFQSRYLVIAYSTSPIGATGFAQNPLNATYFGIMNVDSPNFSNDPTQYEWYLANPPFGVSNYLIFNTTVGNRRLGLAVSLADYVDGGGRFIPLNIAYDVSLWSALPSGVNAIDLDARSGQLTISGTTVTGTGEISILNTQDGRLVGSLKQFLDFGQGITQRTVTVSTLTVDIYGRIVGFQSPDAFYFTKTYFVATSGQTVFAVTRSSRYIVGQVFVYKNGVLLDPSEYTDATASVTLSVGAVTGDQIAITSVSTLPAGSSTGSPAFTSNVVAVINATNIVVSGFTLRSGFELLYLNGVLLTDQDYDIFDQTITNFSAPISGFLTVIQWNASNLGTPIGNALTQTFNGNAGQFSFTFSLNSAAFHAFLSGVLLTFNSDYLIGTGFFSLVNNPNVAIVVTGQSFSSAGAALTT